MFENPEIAFGGTQPMLALIETIYATVQQPELWEVVLEAIAERLNANSSILFVDLPDGVLAPAARTHPEAWTAYLQHYGAINTLSTACDAKFPDGTVRYGHLAMPEGELLRTEFYNDFFRPNDMHWSMGVNVPLGLLPSAYLSSQRAKSYGHYTERDGLVYGTLQPHLQRALLLHAQLAQIQATALGLEAALDAHEHAILGLDADGCIVLSNAAAEALLRSGDGVRSIQGRLRCTLPAADKQLRTLLAQATGQRTGHEGHATGAMQISRKTSAGRLLLTVTRFDAPLAGQGRRFAALVFVSDPGSVPRSRTAVMTDLYRLTPSEGRIADLLLKGLDAGGVANQLHITLETARFHVKRILSKTGARRQAELIRIMLSLPGQ